MKGLIRRVQKLEQVTEERHDGGVCVIDASSDEKEAAQLAAYKEANGEPMIVVRIVDATIAG